MSDYPFAAEVMLTQEQLAAIGCVVVESTYSEAFVEEIIWALCGIDEEHGKYLTNKGSGVPAHESMPGV